MRYSQIDPEAARRRPPPDPSLPPVKPSAKPPNKGFAEFVRVHVGLLKDIGYLVLGLAGIVAWFQSRASRDEVDAAKKQCMESAAAAITSALAPVPSHFKAIEKRLARDGQRWDRLDAFHTKVFAGPNKTPPPKFGPSAERRGEVRYVDEEEDD